MMPHPPLKVNVMTHDVITFRFSIPKTCEIESWFKRSTSCNEEAVLLQRWARDERWNVYFMYCLKIFGSPWLCPRPLFSKLLMGFCCDRSYFTRRPMSIQNLTFLALSVTYWDGYTKNWADPGYSLPRSLFSKSLTGICSDGLSECIG